MARPARSPRPTRASRSRGAGATQHAGEARAFGQLAAERGWQRVAVVTNRAHLTRAAMSVRQCTDAEVAPVAADPGAEPPMRRVRDEWVRTTATATLVRAC